MVGGRFGTLQAVQTQRFVIVLVVERKLKAVLRWVNGELAHGRSPIEAVDGFPLDADEVKRLV